MAYEINNKEILQKIIEYIKELNNEEYLYLFD